MSAPEQSVEKDAGRCTAFPLDGVCFAASPCALHGCNDTDDGNTADGCYCDPARRSAYVNPQEFDCRWCPPGCKSCVPEDCECYTHQDEPDRALGPVQDTP